MAAVSIPAPGTPLGPCPTTKGRHELTCGHLDCRDSRRTAAKVCRICNRPIGYDTRYYVAGDNVEPDHTHAICLEGEQA